MSFPRRDRKTQDQRSADTRELLLEATVEVLFNVGYARLTTTAVCEQAGLSRGAQVYHFPSKWALVTSAVEHLAQRRLADLAEKAGSLLESDDPVGMMLDLMWDSFDGPLFFASLELWVAARTDPELRESLYEMERRLGRAIHDVWREPMIRRGLESRHAVDLVQLSGHLMRGMALQRILKPDDTERDHLLDAWKRIVRAALEGNARPMAVP